MEEKLEFRIPEEKAIRHLAPDVGQKLGWIRRVTLRSDDPLVMKIKELHAQFKADGESFFYGWNVHRRYSRKELEEAKALYCWPKKTFEPAGEECGTLYDDSKACPACGAGAPQTSPLFLARRSLPRNVDFSRTIAGEVIVSARLVDFALRERLRGAEFEAVRHSDAGGAESLDYFQLHVTGAPVELAPRTSFGSGPFDESGYGRCPIGDLVGLNLISEVFALRESFTGNDLLSTRQMVGVRRGLLRPRRLMLLSPRAWRAFDRAGIKGLGVEVAHLE